MRIFLILILCQFLHSCVFQNGSFLSDIFNPGYRLDDSTESNGAGGPITCASTYGTTIQRVSISTAGVEANAGSSILHFSADPSGRIISFISSANNLVAGDTNGADDAFIRDLQNNTTTRVSTDSVGTEGNSDSSATAASEDGRYIAFYSAADNLLAGDTNGQDDLFIKDTQLGTVIRASLSSAGVETDNHAENPGISPDGRYVVYQTQATNLVAGDTNGTWDIFLRDTTLSITTRVSVISGGGEGNGASIKPVVSSDGRYVAFESDATNLVAGDINGVKDVFLHDTQTNTTVRVSVSTAGVEANALAQEVDMSADARYIFFESNATNLVAGDTNGATDIFMRDTLLNITTRVSLTSAGAEANGSSRAPDVTSDGRYLVFTSDATNLVAGDTNGVGDIFFKDLNTGIVTRASVDSGGVEANAVSNSPSISSNNCYVFFYSSATNLVAGDTNGVDDVFGVYMGP